MLELIGKESEGEVSDTLTLPFESRQRSRQRVRLDSGREAAVLLAPGTTLEDGDRLVAADGTAVRVRAAVEALSVAYSDDPLLLARACYHLGNRHERLQVGWGWVGYQPDHVLDEMVRGLGLRVAAERACFTPERGAYGGHGRHQHHHDDHDHHDHHHHDHDHAARHGHHH
jgi:urease accessory protein